MKKEYDFSRGRKNPYIKLLKEQITIRLDKETIAYFKKMAADYGMPYQSLMNMYLRECAQLHKKLHIKWAA